MTSRSPAIRIDPALSWLLAALFLTVPMKWLLSWMVAVCLHEAGHYLALCRCKVPVASVHFGLRGARMQTRELSQVETILCAAAGPAAGFLLTLGARWFPAVAVCGFVQSIYNLFPIPGHDGDRILAGICSLIFPETTAIRWHNRIRAVLLIAVASAVFCLLFV